MNHQNHHRQTTKRSVVDTAGGGVNFRLLCHVDTAGGVIGNSGSLIKHLESQTGCAIQFEEPITNCLERVINIYGDPNIDRKIEIEEVEVEVSRAQEGLIRVYERVSKVEGGDSGGVVGCRLLAISSQIGALMGKGGSIVDSIRKNSGAKIKVLKKDQLPDCALPEEELIQIMGGISAVKKALVPVSRRLQVGLQAGRTAAHVASKGAFYDQSADFPLENKSSIKHLPRNAVNHSEVAHSLSSDVDRVLNLDDSAQRKVAFRLLCSNGSAGGVIGKGAVIVKALEEDTGASIKFSTPTPGIKERVATISALESRDPLYSPAQVATIRVFERAVEVNREHGHIPSVGTGGSISARILVGPHEFKCLLDERGRVSSDIGLAAGVEVQLLGAQHAPNGAAENDKVVQIVGDFDNVKSALFQITGRLRDTCFSSLVPEGAVHRNHSYSSRTNTNNNNNNINYNYIPSVIPQVVSLANTSLHEIGTSMPAQVDPLSSFSSLDKMDHLGFVPHLGGPHTLLQGKQSKGRSNGKPINGSMGGWKSSRGVPDSGRMGENGVAKTTFVITVSGQKFSSVYGENGTNFARLKEISGAAVVLQDPRPGERDGKVIISGSPEQIQIAQSVHQAFMLL